ncbi:hypothetical protein HPB48_002508 [Haemaphysalis longicornis]|uniref:Uncharacterized protein n=1 Tax=Haemaphysalis longicornis TaxID=44386 RepID=A0A9J6G782_HAELO|nr:hypothetical protein HPB48_002508 [Haemaphysalis longicornis]
MITSCNIRLRPRLALLLSLCTCTLGFQQVRSNIPAALFHEPDNGGFVSDIAYLNLALNMGSRCMLNVTTAIKWVHTMEVFPTRVRNFGFAACFTFGRVGGILAPFTRDLVSGPCKLQCE